MLKQADRIISASTNRFVRFGYRRPPPWNFERVAPVCNPNQIPPEHQIDYSSWPELPNSTLHLREIHTPQNPSIVPELAHGLEVALRGDGLYPLEAPWVCDRRHFKKRKAKADMPVYYHDSLRKIVQPENIAWGNIPAYVPAARDSKLHDITSKTPGAMYSSSTSSISPAIAAMYHLLSNFRDTNLLGGLSARIADLPSNFSKFHRRPVAFVISQNESNPPSYSVNAHSGMSFGPPILRELGHSMERMLTMSPMDFENKYVVAEGTKDGAFSSYKSEEQFFHYSQISKFVLRAQIDCRNGNTGEVFDVKTRAVAPIRYDLGNYEAHSSHRLRFLTGRSDSYEREFYDMVRTVFLKYALQLRIGRMSGALVAYHNTKEVLGLEYISLKEIQSYIFGSEEWADVAFGTAIRLLEEIIEKVTESIKLESADEEIKVVLSTEWSKLSMKIFAQRLKKGERDAFGYEEFAKRVVMDTGPKKVKPGLEDLTGCGQWHLDSFLHRKLNGVAMIGKHSDIKKLGGIRLDGKKAEEVEVKSTLSPNSQVFNHNSYDMSSMTADSFRVFDLSVAPLVNGTMAPKHSIYFEQGDSFRLKYRLSEVKDIKNEHYSQFITSLGRIYLR